MLLLVDFRSVSPTGMQFARAAVRTIGVQKCTHGYWSHQMQAMKPLTRRSRNDFLQGEGMTMLPSFVVEYLGTRRAKEIQKAALERKVKQQ